MLVSAKQLTINYPNKSLINSLDLVINPREIMVILGGSGSGKSTLLRVLANINSQTLKLSGEINRNYRNLSFIFQSPILLPYLTVTENINLPLLKLKEGLNEVEKVIKKVGLQDHQSSLPRVIIRWNEIKSCHSPSFCVPSRSNSDGRTIFIPRYRLAK